MFRRNPLFMPLLAICLTVTFANTAAAGEPFHPFWDPIINFFQWFGYF